MKIKHNFLPKMPPLPRAPWVVPTVLAAGVVLGVGVTLSVLLLLKAPSAQPSLTPDAQTPSEETPVTEGDILSLEEQIGTYLFDVDFLEKSAVLTTAEIRTLLSTAYEVRVGKSEEFSTAFRAGVAISDEDYEAYCWSIPAVRRIGTVREEAAQADTARWRDADVYLLDYVPCEGPGSSIERRYLIRPQGASGDLFAVGSVPSLSIDMGPSVAGLITLLRGAQFLPGASIRGLEMPEALTLAAGEVDNEEAETLMQVPVSYFERNRYRFDLEGEVKEIGRATNGMALYLWDGREDGCLLAFAPDGRVYQYASHIPAIVEDGDQSAFDDRVFPRVTWKAAYAAAADKPYLGKTYTGCGALGCAAVVTDAAARAGGGLTVAGTTSEGESVYVPTRLADHPGVRGMYDGWYVPNGEDKPSLSAFLAQFPVPVFYWKDVLGRWVEYRSTDILPMAECGKPVIYLYPEQTTDVSVKLPSFINVTVSDPTYPANGWRVTAQPNGQLTSHADGNTYGSLYWEGTGVAYKPPTEGFVVKDGDVESFLREVLPKYGLNETEAREFMEFWLPEMTGAPYYRVSFLTSAWSEAAPLFVSPRPQTSIRIFMDWKPLNAPLSLPEPTIVTPERNGFTLVEWGGTLWK